MSKSDLLSPQFTAPMAFQTVSARHIASLQSTSNHLGPPLAEPLDQPPRTTRSPGRTWWNSGGTLTKLWWNLNHPTPRTLVEPWWNPGGTLVEPWWNPGGTLPQTTPDHPAALAELGGTLVEPLWNLKPAWELGESSWKPYLKPPRTTPQPSQNLVEPWWNPRGTLPQTTPDHPVALAEPGGTLVEP